MQTSLFQRSDFVILRRDGKRAIFNALSFQSMERQKEGASRGRDREMERTRDGEGEPATERGERQ